MTIYDFSQHSFWKKPKSMSILDFFLLFDGMRQVSPQKGWENRIIKQFFKSFFLLLSMIEFFFKYEIPQCIEGSRDQFISLVRVNLFLVISRESTNTAWQLALKALMVENGVGVIPTPKPKAVTPGQKETPMGS